MAMMGGVMPAQMANPESLASGQSFEFTKMQADLWECVKETTFILDRRFMASVKLELQDEPETREMFYQVLFDHMHVSLQDIKA